MVINLPRPRRVATTAALLAFVGAASACAAQAGLPARLTDAEYWKLVSDISEPGGYFRNSDNFTSNEMEIGRLFTALRSARVTGGAYVGVGPEQNFTYIAAIRPAMAFIIDIRRQAVVQHLMFKAIFELSRDRADFISLTFSRPRPAGLDSTTSIDRMWSAFEPVRLDTALARRSHERIRAHLVNTHRFALTEDELGMLSWVWEAFTTYGPRISTNVGSGRGGGRGGRGGGSDFMGLTSNSRDDMGRVQSFLSTEENYRFVKSLHEKNLIVPVSGDFGGPKALRAIGSYLKGRGATVTAYYVSNVEQYLFQDGKQGAFYANVGTLPVTASSVFIRPYALRSSATTEAGLCPIAPFLRAFNEGRVYGNASALACAR
jgi:hypothetical protein